MIAYKYKSLQITLKADASKTINKTLFLFFYDLDGLNCIISRYFYKIGTGS